MSRVGIAGACGFSMQTVGGEGAWKCCGEVASGQASYGWWFTFLEEFITMFSMNGFCEIEPGDRIQGIH